MAQASTSRPRSLAELEEELVVARGKVQQLEREIEAILAAQAATPTAASQRAKGHALSLKEYHRYGRQMILPAVGLAGQLKLKRSHVLVIGAGGLGCPVLLYLAAAGIGELTILDHDEVELSNLHRQVLHDESRIGMNKAQSAEIGLRRLNSDIVIHSHELPLTPSLFAPSSRSSTPASVLNGDFTLILDCTDNPSTRHFLNAYAVRHKIPLVSGGAVRAEGTVGVFGLRLPQDPNSGGEGQADFGPCYACVFPPSPSILASNTPSDEEDFSEEEMEDKRLERLALQGTGACSDEGVLGLLCGQVGVQMGCEAMRVLLDLAKPTLHLFSPLSANPLRTIKLRARQSTCLACAKTEEDKWTRLETTGEWEGWVDPLCEMPGAGSGPGRVGENRWDAKGLRERMQQGGGKRVRVLDVRPKVEWGICKLEGSENMPFAQFLRDPSSIIRDRQQQPGDEEEIVFVCRRGNDSILAARALQRYLAKSGEEFGERKIEVGDLKGGLVGWSRDVDENFPVY